MNIKQPRKIITLLLHSAIVLVISCLIVWCFSLDTKSLSFFGVIDEAVDVPMSDMYINFQKGRAKLEEKITLVNIDLCDRFEIAKVIEQIDSLNPKVIGLDIIFRDTIKLEADTVLEKVIRKCKNLVIACELKDKQSGNNDKYNTCVRSFFVGREEDNFTEGFVNSTVDAYGTIRTFTPQLFLQKGESFDTIYSFAAQVVRLYNDTAFKKLLQRRGKLEINFQPLCTEEINKNEIENNKEQIKDKIVLVGFFDSFMEDTHKTPTISQMNGIEVHTYIISNMSIRKYT